MVQMYENFNVKLKLKGALSAKSEICVTHKTIRYD